MQRQAPADVKTSPGCRPVVEPSSESIFPLFPRCTTFSFRPGSHFIGGGISKTRQKGSNEPQDRTRGVFITFFWSVFVFWSFLIASYEHGSSCICPFRYITNLLASVLRTPTFQSNWTQPDLELEIFASRPLASFDKRKLDWISLCGNSAVIWRSSLPRDPKNPFRTQLDSTFDSTWDWE